MHPCLHFKFELLVVPLITRYVILLRVYFVISKAYLPIRVKVTYSFYRFIDEELIV